MYNFYVYFTVYIFKIGHYALILCLYYVILLIKLSNNYESKCLVLVSGELRMFQQTGLFLKTY